MNFTGRCSHDENCFESRLGGCRGRCCGGGVDGGIDGAGQKGGTGSLLTVDLQGRGLHGKCLLDAALWLERRMVPIHRLVLETLLPSLNDA